MGLLGHNDMKQFALPTGWDAGELEKYKLADGTTYQQVTDDIIAALLVKMQMLTDDPIYGGLIQITEELGREYSDGTGSAGMQQRTENTRADARRGKTIGHMWPLNSYDRGMGWTWDFLRKARRSQIDSDIATALYDVEDEWQRNILTRFFSTTENQLGSSGYDVPFIKGTGSVAHTPFPYGGQTFASTHTHFDRKTDDATGWAAALEEGAKHLWEHGLMPPYNAITPMADQANFKGLTGFIKPDRGVTYIQAPSTNALTVATVDEIYYGLFETTVGLVRLWATYRLPANYFGLYKTFGPNAPGNPLAVRVSEDLGEAPVLMRGENMRQFPLENAQIIHEYGVGVYDRLNGYAVEFDSSGSYAPPTIS